MPTGHPGTAMPKEECLRPYTPSDEDTIQSIYKQNDLPTACLPESDNPLFVVKQVAELNQTICSAVFIKLIGEAWLIQNHVVGTPEERWEILKSLTQSVDDEAKKQGLEEYSAWLPPDVDKYFGKRMLALGFIKSEWVCYNKKL